MHNRLGNRPPEFALIDPRRRFYLCVIVLVMVCPLAGCESLSPLSKVDTQQSVLDSGSRKGGGL